MSIPLRLHDDLQALVDSLLSFAKSMVSEHGSFNPFGAVMYPDGSIQWVAVDTGEEFPASQALIDGMTGMIRGMRRPAKSVPQRSAMTLSRAHPEERSRSMSSASPWRVVRETLLPHISLISEERIRMLNAVICSPSGAYRNSSHIHPLSMNRSSPENRRLKQLRSFLTSE